MVEIILICIMIIVFAPTIVVGLGLIATIIGLIIYLVVALVLDMISAINRIWNRRSR